MYKSHFCSLFIMGHPTPTHMHRHIGCRNQLTIKLTHDNRSQQLCTAALPFFRWRCGRVGWSGNDKFARVYNKETSTFDSCGRVNRLRMYTQVIPTHSKNTRIEVQTKTDTDNESPGETQTQNAER